MSRTSMLVVCLFVCWLLAQQTSTPIQTQDEMDDARNKKVDCNDLKFWLLFVACLFGD